LSKKDQVSSIQKAMDNAMFQIKTQVQFAFAEFPHQEMILTYCIIGKYWRAMDFYKNKTSDLPECTLLDTNYQ